MRIVLRVVGSPFNPTAEERRHHADYLTLRLPNYKPQV